MADARRRAQDELDERKRRILAAVIEDYVASASPVGSRTLSRNHGMTLSSAINIDDLPALLT